MNTYRKIDTAVVDNCCSVTVSVDCSEGLVTLGRRRIGGHAPLILYSPVSWLLVLRMLRTEEALFGLYLTWEGIYVIWGLRTLEFLSLQAVMK